MPGCRTRREAPCSTATQASRNAVMRPAFIFPFGLACLPASALAGGLQIAMLFDCATLRASIRQPGQRISRFSVNWPKPRCLVFQLSGFTSRHKTFVAVSRCWCHGLVNRKKSSVHTARVASDTKRRLWLGLVAFAERQLQFEIQ